MKFGLRERILFPILILIVLGMGLTIYFSNKYSKQSISEITDNSMIKTVEETVKNLDNWIESRELVLKTLADIKIYQKASIDDFQGRALRKTASSNLENYINEHNVFESVSIVDNKGKVVASSSDERIELDISDRKYFINSFENNIAFVQAVKSRITDKVSIILSVPLKDEGKICGIIYSTLNFEEFTKKYIEDIKIGEKGYIFITDEKGLVLHHPVKKLIYKAGLYEYEFGKKMLEQKKGYMQYLWGKVPTISAFDRVEKTGWFVVTRVDPGEIYSGIKKLQKINFTIAGLTIFLMAVSIVLIVRFIILNPVKKAVSFAKKIASGDLNARVRLNRNDELGELVESLNSMGSRLTEMFSIEKLRELVKSLSEGSMNLKKVSEDMDNEINTAVGMAAAIFKETSEMTDNINESASDLDISATNISTIASGAEQMSSTISEIAVNVDKTGNITKAAVEKAKFSSTKIDQLGIAAKEIDAVTNTIRDISDQTNLLALNATIEAARAGEAGKGFAVVAGEIKALASQTASATKDIAEKIKNIQKSTQETVTDINEIAATIDNIHEFVGSVAAAIEEQSVTTKEIAGSVNQASARISGVNEKMSFNSNSAKSINNDISNMEQITGKLKSGSSHINSSSLELQRISKEVKDVVDQFKI
ncbi:MAG: methyl-accepting chemotaxis protein [Desulforegulaceae bacterium]|nr:methyl-accepting chemotaxis protein [Desulforegulaceae bacterium]